MREAMRGVLGMCLVTLVALGITRGAAADDTATATTAAAAAATAAATAPAEPVAAPAPAGAVAQRQEPPPTRYERCAHGVADAGCLLVDAGVVLEFDFTNDSPYGFYGSFGLVAAPHCVVSADIDVARVGAETRYGLDGRIRYYLELGKSLYVVPAYRGGWFTGTGGLQNGAVHGPEAGFALPLGDDRMLFSIVGGWRITHVSGTVDHALSALPTFTLTF